MSPVHSAAPARRIGHHWLALAMALLAACRHSPVDAALGLPEALDLASQSAPSLRAGEAAWAGATAVLPAAGTLPDPRLSVGVENLPIAGPDRWRTARDSATMQRLSLMQEVPNRAKREARLQMAQARIDRERATLAVAALAVRRDAALAWLAAYHAQRRQALLADARQQNRLLQDTVPARVTAGTAQAADLTMARQDALALDDRGDDLARDLARTRAELRRWVGARADEPLAGPPALPAPDAAALRTDLHRHAELAPFGPMRDLARAELSEADADRQGDWSWELAYNRRPRYDDMVSFQVSVDLPWQRDRRQQPAVEAKRREAERVEAERDDALRRHTVEVDSMLAELAAVDAQLARLQGPGLALAAERVALTLAAYQAGRGDLGVVLQARSQAIEQRLRAIELESQRDALRVRLSTLTAE